jgi:histidinol phosphatase-like PHP family hydrolase
MTNRQNQPDTTARGASSCQYTPVARRHFLAAGLATLGSALIAPGITSGAEKTKLAASSNPADPPEDLHVHLDNSTIDKVLELSIERGVVFGIVEHAGTKENKYPVMLSNDEELQRYLEMLKDKPVYRGVQAEWIDWSDCFSKEMLARLDFVLMDAMTFPGKDGRRVKLWEKGVESRVEMSDRQAFMDRYVDWYVEIIEKQPIDILGNCSWLPRPLADDYEAYWTTRRVCKVVEAARKHRVALEINSKLKLPKRYFLEIAKAAGAKFTFGSNGRYPEMGKLAYSIEMARALNLGKTDLFTPATKKAIQIGSGSTLGATDQ